MPAFETGSYEGYSYVRHTDQEIKELALSAMSGSVFGTWSLREHEQDMLPQVFMPLCFMNIIDRKIMVANGVVHFYEYLSKAGPRSINGLPMFTSMRAIDQEDIERLNTKIKQIEAI